MKRLSNLFLGLCGISLALIVVMVVLVGVASACHWLNDLAPKHQAP